MHEVSVVDFVQVATTSAKRKEMSNAKGGHHNFSDHNIKHFEYIPTGIGSSL